MGFRAKLGVYLGVPPTDIRLTVSAASVRVVATIYTLAGAPLALTVCVRVWYLTPTPILPLNLPLPLTLTLTPSRDPNPNACVGDDELAGDGPSVAGILDRLTSSDLAALSAAVGVTVEP